MTEEMDRDQLVANRKYHVMRHVGGAYERVYSCDRAEDANRKVLAYGRYRHERWTQKEYAEWLVTLADAQAKIETQSNK